MDLVKAVVEKEALEKKTQELKEALDKMNSQLAVNAQMFEGLKGQYNELERDYEKLNLRLQEKSQKVA